MIGFNYRKAVQTLNFFALKEGGKINKMKAIKLIWLADRAHLRKFGRPLIADQYFAMPFGPVPSSTKDLAENNSFLADDEKKYRDEFISLKSYNVHSEREPDKIVFSQTDLEIMESIYENFGRIKEFELSEISHKYPEWKKFETALQQGEGSRFPMNYLDFFENPPPDTSDYFACSPESLDLSRSIFQENMEFAKS